MSKMLTVKEVQDLLRLNKNTIYKLINLSGFPKIKIGGKTLIPEDELNDYIKQYMGGKINI